MVAYPAVGLIEGYVVEKATLEESLQQKESQEQKLVEELEAMRLQMQELSEENGLLLRQRDALSGVLGEPERGEGPGNCPDRRGCRSAEG